MRSESHTNQENQRKEASGNGVFAPALEHGNQSNEEQNNCANCKDFHNGQSSAGCS
jgi:hypothetical protein